MDTRRMVMVLAAVTVSLAGLGLWASAPAQAEPAGVESSSIDLNKTVGLNPAVCATTDEIALPAGGGAVTYCFSVENTGDVALSLHDLEDSELGTILDGFSYTLLPGASAFLTQTAWIDVTAVNTATWAAYNAGGADLATATDTAMVTVEPAMPAIVLTKTVGTDPSSCAVTDEITLPVGGAAVTYCFAVENTGNLTLSFHDLVDSELGVILDGFSFALMPGASVFLTQTAWIDVTTVNTATWTAYNAVDADLATAMDSATVYVGFQVHLPVVLRQ